MVMKLDEEIRKSRMALQNPYAHLDDSDGFDAISQHRQMNVHEARRILQNQYAFLDEKGGYSEYPQDICDSTTKMPGIAIEKVNPQKKPNQKYHREDIEKIAWNLQKEMWVARKELIPSREEVSPMEILDPSLALNFIGYDTEIHDSLGQYSGQGELFEVAGIIDKTKGEVQISRRFSPVIRNFTLAHELGHSVLHEGTGLHRDRALDGAPGNRTRDSQETEADIFAAYFLMPEKQIIAAFEKIFLETPFVLNENTAFALASESLETLQNRFRTVRDLSRYLASTERYNGVYVVSLAQRFKVSNEAMAIRLEELDLVHL